MSVPSCASPLVASVRQILRAVSVSRICVGGPVGRLLAGRILPRANITIADAIQIATTNRHAVACVVLSIATPATSGPTKLVDAPIMLKLLKLRARSAGLLMRPTRFCASTCRIASARPLNAAAIYSAGIECEKYGIVIPAAPLTAPNKRGQRGFTRSDKAPIGHEKSSGNA